MLARAPLSSMICPITSSFALTPIFVNLCMNKICKKWSHRKDCFLDHFRSLPSFALTPIFVNLCIKKFGSLPITTDSEFRESVYKENMQKVESPERLLFAHPHELGL